MQYTDEEPKGQTQDSGVGSLVPKCSLHCPALHWHYRMPFWPFISIGCNYLHDIFLFSSSNCCTRNTVGSLLVAVSPFHRTCFEFGFSHPVAVCALPPSDWHHDQYPLPNFGLSVFVCKNYRLVFSISFSVMKIFNTYSHFSAAFHFCALFQYWFFYVPIVIFYP